MLTIAERKALQEANNVAPIKRSYPRNGATVSAPTSAAGPDDGGAFSADWQDNLGTAKGIVIGAILGSLMWLTIYLLWPAV